MPQDLTNANLNTIVKPTPKITLSKDVIPNNSSSTNKINNETCWEWGIWSSRGTAALAW